MVKVLSPLGIESSPVRIPMPHVCPSDLEGKTLGLLSNGKPNAMELLTEVGDRLVQRFSMRDAVALDKRLSAHGPGRQAPEWMVELLTKGPVAVLTASGD